MPGIITARADSASDASDASGESREYTNYVYVQPKYLEQIRSGIKTFEGRPARERYMRWRAGDVIRFLPTVSRGRRRRKVSPCEMRITSTQHFKGFRDMLKTVGVRSCLPNLKDGDIDKGVCTYHSFGNFKKEVESVGARAFELGPV